MLLKVLPVAVMASLAIAFVSLAILITRTLAFGRKPSYSRAQGNTARGLLYAFGQGMMPWEKESAAKHLPTFTAGIVYHAAIFGAIALLVVHLAPLTLSSTILKILRLVILAGLVSGLGLLAKRFAVSGMRAISCPDDFLANVLVDLFLAAAFAVTLFDSIQPYFFITAIILFLYIPAGKIRHCFFFFYTRILFGTFFGRRGVLPHHHPEI